jgi:hypothetical protein
VIALVVSGAGVHLVGGDDVWALHEPGSTADHRRLPWAQFIGVVAAAVAPP